MKGVEGDLAQHEGPVLGENLGQVAREELVAAQALVNKCGAGGADLLHGVGRGVGGTHPRSQKLGPTGSWKSDLATRNPSSSRLIGNCGMRRAAGPKITSPESARSKVDWWQGHSRWCVRCSYRAMGQPTWVQILE